MPVAILPIKVPSPLRQFFRTHPKGRFLFLSVFWFLLGAFIGLFFFSSFVYIYYKQTYAEKVYPGVSIEQKDLGGKTQEEVRTYFAKKNDAIAQKPLFFIADETIATISAKQLGLGYDENLLASQAYSIGRNNNIFSDIYHIFQSYIQGIALSPAYRYSEKNLKAALKPFQDTIDVEPVNAQFSFENERVTEFRTSKDGKKVAVAEIETLINQKITPLLLASKPSYTIEIPVTVSKPEISTDEVNDMGIKERIGVGTSLYVGSIPNRIFNLTLAASRINGVLIEPGEEFSFNKAVGDISSLSGYKQAYIISGGRTILGDGGGVCQVSTTFFRALLNAGLPITERNQHAYRVSYYEQDSRPGIDAAIYTPNVDLQFKNDTGKHILVQATIDASKSELTFELFGTSDGRVATVSEPVIVSQTPAPEPLYQDDPEMPKGQVKQIDFAASGAVVYFTTEVKRNGKTIISEKYTSRYRPWQAVFLRGTKEG